MPSPVRQGAGAGPAATRPFTALEDAIAHAERPGAPMLMGFILECGGRLDGEILDAALDEALARCPMLLARRAPIGSFQRWPRWVWGDAAPVVVDTVPTTGHRTTDLWDRLLAAPVPLDTPPLLRVVHQVGPSTDALLVAVHHAAVDGIGALRFLQELAAAYSRRAAGSAAPVVTGTVTTEPSGAAPVASGPDVASRPGRALDVLRAPASARVASDRRLSAGPTAGGIGVSHRWVEPALASAVTAGARATCVTVTDLLVAALHLTVDGWNRSHGARADTVTVTVPVRPGRPTPDDPWGDPTTNRTLQVTTSTSPALRVDPSRVVGAVHHQLAAVRREAARPTDPAAGPAGASEPAASRALALLPERVRRQVPTVVSMLGGDRFLASSRLSNLGVVPAPSLAFGPVPVTHLGFSPPVRMPQGIALGVAGFGPGIDIAFRWCQALLDREAAEHFADRYVQALARVARA